MPVRADVLQGRSGAYGHRVGVLVPGYTTGTSGAQARTWTLREWLWCSVTPMTAGEDEAGGVQFVAGAAAIRTRWRQDLRADMRLLVSRYWTQLGGGGVNDSATAWTVADGSVSPMARLGDFVARCGDELVKVTAGHGTTSWTVTRGLWGTTPAAHAEGVDVIEQTVYGIDGIVDVEAKRRELVIGGMLMDGDGD